MLRKFSWIICKSNLKVYNQPINIRRVYVMEDNIKKIYDMMYSPIVTPYNLLENAKLNNYSYVKYYKSNDGLIAEMECFVEDEGNKIFYYHFDANDYLSSIYMEHNGKKQKVFDRENAIEEAKEEYYSKKSIYENAI